MPHRNPPSLLAVAARRTAGCVVVLLCAIAGGAQSIDPAAQINVGGSSASQVTAPDEPSGSSDAGGSIRSGLSSSGSLSDSGSPLMQDGQGNALGLTAPPLILPADRILRILESQPSLTVEVKSAIADQMTAQGVPTDANSFTDEQLYSLIAKNQAVRAQVTTYLRARGYLGTEDLAAGSMGEPASAAGDSSSSADIDQADGKELDSHALTHDQDQHSPALRTRSGRARTTTDQPAVLHAATPYNLESLRDLYSQLPEDSTPLRRFGSDFFARASSSMGRGASDAPLDIPLGPDYVVRPGDALTINIWGGASQTLNRVVNRDGALLLSDAGSLQVAGLTLGRVEAMVQGVLLHQFRDAHSSVTVSRLHTVRVYIAGDVMRPGGYELSPLATPLSALYVAGGPSESGSLRIVRHMRGTQLVEEVDLYDFLLHGVRAAAASFESGDTLMVPPAGPQVAIGGSVRRPAIYELAAGEHTLHGVIEDAGGLLPAAAADQIRVERIDPAAGRLTLTLPHTSSASGDHAAREAFAVQDGDHIFVGSLLPYSKQVIYLAGHVARPGRVAYRGGMRLSDVLRSQLDLLPEPDSRGEVVRIVPPDLHAETLPFDLHQVLNGQSDMALQPFDTVRVLGRYERDAPTVTVTGEVQRPGSYPLSDGMTAAQLVRMAGGFKRAAVRETADLTSYSVGPEKRVEGSLATVRIGAAVDGSDPSADHALKAGDVLAIREITGWNDIGQSITVEGQVRFPGTYGFRDGEKLSTVLLRAGGLRETAYPEGAVLVREQVKELQQKSRDELVRQIQTNAASARVSPHLAAGTDAGTTMQVIKAQQEQVLADLKAHPPTGRMVIHISADIGHWASTTDDIELRRGDVLTIPKKPGFVLVTGQVFNGTALTYAPGKTAGWYLSRAGGASQSADRRNIFVIRANGTVVGRHSREGWFAGDVLSTRMDPGDVVVVPQKIVGPSLLWRNLLSTAQLASSIAITTAVSGL